MFEYKNQQLYFSGHDVNQLAIKYGTPLYAYSSEFLQQRFNEFAAAFKKHPCHIHYAVKANSNLAMLNLFATLGCGFDIVSQGELQRVLAAKGQADKIIFSGVGKSIDEINFALQKDIFCFNVESIPELERIQQLAKQANKIAKINLRINPNIEVDTHHHITTGTESNKFGIAIENLNDALERLKNYKNIRLIGLAAHLGSQIESAKPYQLLIAKLLDLAKRCEQALNYQLEYLDIGGGFAVDYRHQHALSINDFAKVIIDAVQSTPYQLIIEPGRKLVAESGILITKIEYVKQNPNKNFLICDAGMNDFMRPALYEAKHDIIPSVKREDIKPQLYDVVGPVCESTDCFAQAEKLAVIAEDYLIIKDCGAYGSSMSSHYNSRAKAAEILLDGEKILIIRKREELQQLYADEILF